MSYLSIIQEHGWQKYHGMFKLLYLILIFFSFYLFSFLFFSVSFIFLDDEQAYDFSHMTNNMTLCHRPRML